MLRRESGVQQVKLALFLKGRWIIISAVCDCKRLLMLMKLSTSAIAYLTDLELGPWGLGKNYRTSVDKFENHFHLRLL